VTKRLLTIVLGALALCALGFAVASGAERARTGHDDVGTAQLWVTRDRGQTVLLSTTVPAGQTILRALRSQTKVETRFGGRFVQAIDGLAGDAQRQRDWFWFVNGLAGDRSAAEYRLRNGDVAWWDYRRWHEDAARAVVAGAFPEPLLHGYDGRVRPIAVRYDPRVGSDRVARLARTLHADDVETIGAPVVAGANVIVIRTGAPTLRARMRRNGSGPRGAVVFEQTGWPATAAYRHRFSLP
jgi:Domain of unknown function (DUF4430)